MAKGWLRFRDLKARGIVQSWPQLKRLIELYGFPSGRMISPNTRAWAEEDIDAYYRSCPVEGPAPRGAAKRNQARARKADSTATATST
jgi:hypothetical protein